MRVALLTNFIAPYRVPLLEALRDRVGTLRVFLSTPMEENRDWKVDWGSLDVVVQRNVTLRQRHCDNAGFSSHLLVHLPYDTLPQLRRFRPDVVISGEFGVRSLQAALHRLIWPKAALLVWATLSERTERDRDVLRRGLRRAILKVTDGVLTNGESGARYIAGFGVADERIFRINQPVAVDLFRAGARTRTSEAPLRLLHVGQLIARKGVIGFMERLREWAGRHPDREVEIWWAGDGDQRRLLEELFLPPNLAQRFLGSLPYAELPAIYGQCDILAFPSLADEWGLVCNEALAAGMPVLGSIYSQAVEELIVEGETGWLFDPLSKVSTMAAIDQALNVSLDRLATMRETAQARIAALTPEAAADRIMEALRKVVAGTDRAPDEQASAPAAPPGVGARVT